MAPALSKEFLEIQANYRMQIYPETRTWHDNNMQLIRLRYCKARVEPHSNEIHITHYIKYVFHGLVVRDCMTSQSFYNYIDCFFPIGVQLPVPPLSEKLHNNTRSSAIISLLLTFLLYQWQFCVVDLIVFIWFACSCGFCLAISHVYVNIKLLICWQL